MLEKLKNFFKKETPETTATIAYGIPKSQYSFVEQYIIVDPQKVQNGGYGFRIIRKFTLVAYEGKKIDGKFLPTIQLPTDWALFFLKRFKRSAPEVRNDPTQRLISIIHLDDKHKLYVVPNLKTKKGSAFVGGNTADKERKNDWVFYVTPEINRAIVEQVKIRTRS